MKNQRRNVQQDITTALERGRIILTYKTKAGVGRKSVTVGKYRQAVGPMQYALIINGDTWRYTSAISAAQAFIEYVGRDDAWNALHGRGRERNPQ